jgi:hypothetical protein
MTNRLLFGDRFDQPGGRSEALHFSDRKSNLPPSKEVGREIAIMRTGRMFGSGRYFR